MCQLIMKIWLGGDQRFDATRRGRDEEEEGDEEVGGVLERRRRCVVLAGRGVVAWRWQGGRLVL